MEQARTIDTIIRPAPLITGLLLCALLLGSASVSRADFEDTGYGARATGMGNAFTGLADDVYSVMYNPAGLVNLKERQMGAGYRRLYWGLDDYTELAENTVVYAQPLLDLPAWVKRYLPDTSDYGAIGGGIANFSAGALYTENSLYFSYARSIEDIVQRPLTLGVNLKILNKKYGSDIYTENAIDFSGNTYGRDPVFAGGYSKSALGIDVGALYRINQHYDAGLLLRNLNTPDTGLSDSSRLPLHIKAGINYHDTERNVLVDTEYRAGDVTLAPGIEKWLMARLIGVRAGLQIGSRDLANLSCGASYRSSDMFRIDYSFKLPLKGVRGTYGTHDVSLVVGFGSPARAGEAAAPRPDGYEDALSAYKDHEYIRAYERFSVIAASAPAGPYQRRAKQYVEKIISSNRAVSAQLPAGPEQLYAAGLLLYVERNSAAAVQQWEEFLKARPENAEVAEYAAILSKRQAEERQRVIEGYLSEARALSSAGEYQKALGRIAVLLEMEPGHAEAGLLADEIKAKMEEEKKAKLSEYHMRALMLYTDKRFREAIAEWQKCLKLDPQFADAVEYIQRSREEIEKLNRRPVPEPKPVEKPIEPPPTPTPVIDETKAEGFYNSALIKYTQGKLDEAITDLREALLSNPGHKGAGEALNRIQSEYDQQKAAAQAAPIDEAKAEEYYNSALIKYAHGRLEEALSDLKEALGNNPGHKGAVEALNRIQSEFDQQKSAAPAAPVVPSTAPAQGQGQ